MENFLEIRGLCKEYSEVIRWLNQLNGPLVMALAAVVIYVLGYLLGCSIYEKSEF